MDKLSILKTKKFILPNKTNTADCHIWYADNSQEFMFKYNKENINYSIFINEVLISCIAKEANIECQQATFASFHKVNGVKIKSFLDKTKGEKEIKIYDIVNEKYLAMIDNVLGSKFFSEIVPTYIKSTYNKNVKGKENKIDTTLIMNDAQAQLDYIIKIHLNIIECDNRIKKIINDNYQKLFEISTLYNKELTDEDIYSYIQEYSKKYNYNLDENIVTNLCKMVILDYVTMQEDRHTENISLILQNKTLRLAPMFDNGRCLLFNKCRMPTSYMIRPTAFTYKNLNTNKELATTDMKLKKLLFENESTFVDKFIKNNHDALINFVPNKVENKEEWISKTLNAKFKLMKQNYNLMYVNLNKNVDKQLI